MLETLCYFKNGQYYFGTFHDLSSKIPNEHIISYDEYVYESLCDSFVEGLVIVRRDDKFGVFTLSYTTYTEVREFCSNIYPFLYDEMWLNGSFNGDCVGFITVRINHYWGVLRVQEIRVDAKRRAGRSCMMFVPCIYPTKEKAISFIHSKDYHPEYGWRDPFKDDNIY